MAVATARTVMRFCEECGSLMHPTDDQMVCVTDNCTGTSERDRDQESSFVTTDHQTDAEVIESTEAAAFEGKPIASDVRCESCSHTEAWYVLKQTASADEPPTRFFKCTECGYRWREYN